MSKQSERLFVKPTNPEIKVRNPERGRHLKIEGEWVPKNAYWFRRERDGDIEQVKPPKKSATKSKES